MSTDAERLSAARANYDRLAPWYDAIAGAFEWPLARLGLAALGARSGERVLEVGFGTGRALAELARAVGADGSVLGVDLSPGMAKVAARRLASEGLAPRVRLEVGDALALPLEPTSLDAAFSAFTLETLPREEAVRLLSHLRQALRPGGRLVLVSMATGDRGAMSSLYAWSHRAFPRLVDCAPIDAPALLEAAGLAEVRSERERLAGIAVSIARAVRP